MLISRIGTENSEDIGKPEALVGVAAMDATIAKQSDAESWHCAHPMLHGGPTRNRTTHSMGAPALRVACRFTSTTLWLAMVLLWLC